MVDIDKIFAIAVLKYFQKVLAEGQAARTRVAIDYITTVFRKKCGSTCPYYTQYTPGEWSFFNLSIVCHANGLNQRAPVLEVIAD
jgi:hypothetical protein